jgi:3'(2'), 5'-bisphosphate nucleotidase
MQKNLEIAITAALEAGIEIMKIYETEDFSVEFKKDDSPLTKADIASNECIMKYLEKTGIPVLSEEGKEIPYEERKNWNQLWIVDPIDGTKEFIKRNGDFTVNIALIENHIPVLGVIYVPALKELYFSSRESGSFKIEAVDHSSTFDHIFQNAQNLPLKTDRSKYTVVASRSHLSQETKDFIDQLILEHGEVESISKGSSLKLCMVAEGSADCYPRFAPTMEWDTAAGQAICKYAGFMVEDRSTGKEMIYNRPELLNNWFLVY